MPGTRHRPSLRAYLLILVVITLAPVLAFSVWLVVRLHAQERAMLEHGLEETAQALTIAVDREIERAITTLQTLATSDNLRMGNIARFRAQAAAVVAAHGGLTHIALTDGDGRQLMNLLFPKGVQLPQVARPDLIRVVAQTGQPLTTDLIEVPAERRLLVRVEVPVFHPNRPTDVLIGGIAPETMARAIVQQGFPEGWIASIHDGEGRIIGRSVGPDTLVGQPGPPALRSAAAAARPTGVVRFTTSDGHRQYAGWARSALSAWVVSVGAPQGSLEASLRHSLLIVAVAGAVLTFLGCALALVVGRRIARPLVALSTAAPAVVRGERVALATSSTREIRDLVAALEKAADDRTRANDLLRAVFDGTNEGIFVKDLAGRYVMMNEAGARLIGKPVDAILDRDDTALFAADSAARIIAQDREVIAAGQPRAFENVSIATIDGSVRSYLSTKTPYRDAAGRIIGLIGLTRDITERKRAEQEREALLAGERLARRDAEAARAEADAARAVAEAANRTKDQFLAVLSHELRTPLNAVLGWVGMLRTTSLDPATTTRALDAIERNGRALAQLVSDLLDVSRIISGKLRLDARAIDLISVIEAALDALRPAADAKGIRIHSGLDPHAGPVLGDPDRLQQVVWNLVANAIKFTPRRGRVEVSLVRTDSHVEIVVSDNGAGINAQLLPYIFDRFRQGDSSSTRAHGGLGLGLALVKHLTELHGGTVEAESLGEGKGATFIVKLPSLVVRTDSRSADRTDRITEHQGPQLGGLRIAVVDDDPDSLELLATLLRRQDAEVRTATSAAEALAVVEEWKPDLLVADIEMPGEDGYSLVRRLRALPTERGGATPAVAVTAYGRVEDRIRSVSAGFDLHLPKPVEPAELIAVVANLARRR